MKSSIPGHESLVLICCEVGHQPARNTRDRTLSLGLVGRTGEVWPSGRGRWTLRIAIANRDAIGDINEQHEMSPVSKDQDWSSEMSQDMMFFVITSLIVVSLVVIGPVAVVWQYQRAKTVTNHDKPAESRPAVLTGTPPRSPENI